MFPPFSLTTNFTKKKAVEYLIKKVTEKVIMPTQNDISKPFYLSKKFWVTALGVVIPIINKLAGWELDITEIASVLAPLVVYVLGQGIADAGKNKR